MFKKILLWGLVFVLNYSLASASCYDLKSNNAEYLKCRSDILSIFNQWYTSFNASNYTDAIMYYERYLIENWETSDQNYLSARYNIWLAYTKLGTASFYKKEFSKAVWYFLSAIQYWDSSYELQYNLAASYYNLGEYSNAGLHATNAYNLAYEKVNIADSSKLLTDIESKIKLSNAKSDAVTNDPFVYLQYYITDLKINEAWKQIPNPKQVIVAVIDDWININHPDLTQNIWISRNAKYGTSKIISFQDDLLADNATAWEHGTMVAGIIGATSWNNEWIAWISRNVKLMPIRIFDTNGNTKETFIIKAIEYAIDNWANIINLSLGWKQFKYSKSMDEVIKKAYDRWIFVVIAWWNGDVLAKEQNWVNLDINPIAPVCNNKWNNYSFGVFATDKLWYRTLWTNYGKCTPFFAPWEGIVSTSVALYNEQLWINYNQLDWTSFSTPIVTWVLALGYNKFGKVPYSVAYDALSKSTTTNAKGNPVLDANKYLNNLQAYFDRQNLKKLEWLKRKAQLQFDRYKKQYARLSTDTQKSKYQSLLTSLQRKNKILKWDNLLLNNLIIDLVNAEVSKL